MLWTSGARADLVRLRNFLTDKSPDAAQRALSTIQQGVLTLTEYPDVGRPFDDEAIELREWFIPFGDSGYVALYRKDAGRVVILAVRHAREAGY
jgi:plasmid stabilization system protein ParE